MSKVRFNPGLLLAAALFITLAACKKDDDQTASFVLRGESSLHFEYGQTKSAEFTSRYLQSFEETEVPEGWGCSVNRTNSTIDITAPANSGAGDASGEIKVTATSTSGSELTVTIAVAVKTAEEITDAANCFLITEPGKRFKFNAGRKGNQTSVSMSPAGAKLVWTSVRDAVGHISLENGYIYFSTGDEETLMEANAVVAAVDGDDEILWSWHIWAADYDPDADADQLAGETVMNRNLGAFASSFATTDEVLASYGLYYQWGRKDPFVGPKAWDSTDQLGIFNSNTASRSFALTYIASTADEGTIEYATANPTTFIAGVEASQYDWLYAGRNNNLWSSDTKTVYDPCPAGWMVAPASIWASFTSTERASSVTDEFNVDNEFVQGEWFGWVFSNGGTGIYYPAAGRRSFSKTGGNFTNKVETAPVGFYWSSTPDSANRSLSLCFNKDYINPGVSSDPADDTKLAEGARAGGFPLRCVKE